MFRRGLNGRDRDAVSMELVEALVELEVSLHPTIQPGGSSDNERSSSQEGAYMMVYVNDTSCTVVEEEPTIGPHYIAMFQREYRSRPLVLEHQLKTVVSSITLPTHPSHISSYIMVIVYS